jgi:TldD protein
MIADTKDGVLIDGRGSYSIDQQRYNGSSAATASGRSRRQEDADGERRHLQRDHHRLLGNLDAISGQESWRMYGTGGDAKGQPTQTNSISHGSPVAAHQEDHGRRRLTRKNAQVRSTKSEVRSQNILLLALTSDF